VEVQNDTIDSLTNGGAPCRMVRPGVFEVSPELGAHLLRFAHQGWRLPDPISDPPPAPAEGPRPFSVTNPTATDAVTVEEVRLPELTAPPVPDLGLAPAPTVPEALVAMAKRAGEQGLTSTAAVAAHGRQCYNILGVLVDRGLLVRVSRGVYRHPDFA